MDITGERIMFSPVCAVVVIVRLVDHCEPRGVSPMAKLCTQFAEAINHFFLLCKDKTSS